MRSSFGFDFPIAVDDRFFPSIAKVGARMAQLFSNTYVGTLDAGANIVWNEVHVPDLERNGHNFSDGIGTISLDAFDQLCRPSLRPALALVLVLSLSLSLALALALTLPLPLPLPLPLTLTRHLGVDVPAFASGCVSAFQFRFKGFKGMLSVDPEAPSKTI